MSLNVKQTQPRCHLNSAPHVQRFVHVQVSLSSRLHPLIGQPVLTYTVRTGCASPAQTLLTGRFQYSGLLLLIWERLGHVIHSTDVGLSALTGLCQFIL